MTVEFSSDPDFERNVGQEIELVANEIIQEVVNAYSGNEATELADLLDRELQDSGLEFDGEYLLRIAANALGK